MSYFSDAMRNDGYSEQEIQDEFDWLGVDPSIDTDWQDEVLRTAPITNSSLSISGGSSRFRYLVSGSYFDQTGIVIGSSYGRASGRVNLDLEATDRINVAVSMSLSQEVNERIEADNSIVSAVTNAIANEPWVPVYNDDGTYSSAASYAARFAVSATSKPRRWSFPGYGPPVAWGSTTWTCGSMSISRPRWPFSTRTVRAGSLRSGTRRAGAT
jgi:hypothetical protein